jgi:ribose transport system permease protein
MSAENSFKSGVLRILSKNVIFFALLGMCIILSFLSDRFLSTRNFMNVIMQNTTMGVVAVGMTFVIITGGIDLSVGSVLAVSAAIGAGAMKAGFPIVVGLFILIGVGAIFGFFQGILISRLHMPAFIVTLGGMSIARGCTMVFMQGKTITGLPASFQFFGAGNVIGKIPCAVVILALVYVFAFYVLKYTAYGRSLYALGGNREATELSGINTRKVEAVAFVVSGVASGLGAIILTSRLGAAIPTGGVGLEMEAIGAVVIGGASLAGGRGTIFGTLIGVFILGVLNNGLNLLNVDPFFSGVVMGSVILIAVLIDTLKKQYS